MYVRTYIKVSPPTLLRGRQAEYVRYLLFPCIAREGVRVMYFLAQGSFQKIPAASAHADVFFFTGYSHLLPDVPLPPIPPPVQLQLPRLPPEPQAAGGGVRRRRRPLSQEDPAGCGRWGRGRPSRGRGCCRTGRRGVGFRDGKEVSRRRSERIGIGGVEKEIIMVRNKNETTYNGTRSRNMSRLHYALDRLRGGV